MPLAVLDVRSSAAVLEAAGRRRIAATAQPGRFFGIHVPEAAEPPKGWRHSHTADCAVPGKRTTIGRTLAARLDEISALAGTIRAELPRGQHGNRSGLPRRCNRLRRLP